MKMSWSRQENLCMDTMDNFHKRFEALACCDYHRISARKEEKMIPTKPRWLAISLGICLALLGLGSTHVAIAQFDYTHTAPINRMTTRVSLEPDCVTTTSTLEPFPGTSVKFVQGGNESQEILVTFISEWIPPFPNQIPPGSQAAAANIFLFIDGDRVEALSEQGGVTTNIGNAAGPIYGTFGWTFLTRAISPGEHVAEIYVLDNILGPAQGTVCSRYRTTIVQYRSE
jgi:hypothetical protein